MLSRVVQNKGVHIIPQEKQRPEGLVKQQQSGTHKKQTGTPQNPNKKVGRREGGAASKK